MDNLGNSHMEVLSRVRTLASRHHDDQGLPQNQHPPLYFHPVDIRDRNQLEEVLKVYAMEEMPYAQSRIVSAIHFAALKSVSGSSCRIKL